MCGIIGIAGRLAYKDEATMKRLFLLDFFRGPDSTGLAAIRSNGDALIAKLPSHPLDLFDSTRFKAALNGHSSTVFIGHNRAATRGLVTGSNAHPYTYDHITGAHNGTLTDKSHKALEELTGEKFSVDSQAIFAAIAKVGIEDTIAVMETGNSPSTGAWSLVWYDKSDNTLNFLRNEHRPMWYAFTEEYDRLFWASEWPMIEGAIRLSNDDYKLAKDKEGYQFFPTDADVWYSFDVDALKAGSKVRPKPLAKTLKGKELVTAVTTVASNDPFLRREWEQTTHHGTTIHRGGTTNGSAGSPKIIEILGDVTNPFGGYMKREAFEELAKYGCSWCSASVEWGEKGVVIFGRDDILVCPACSASNKNSNRLVIPFADGVAA